MRDHPSLKRALFLSCLVLASASGRSQTAGKTAEELFAKALALHQSGDTLGAIQYYRAGLEQQPDRVEARSNLGAAYMKLGRYEEAIAQYRRALSVNPGLAGLRMNLGLAFYKSDRLGEAVPEFEAVLKADPKSAPATLLLADCWLRVGEEQKVIDLLTPHEAGELGKDRLFSYLLGTALIERNQVVRGQQVIDRLFREGDEAVAHLLVGTQYLRQGVAIKALPELEKAVALNPELPTVHALYARALRENHDHEAAAREYQKELERNPNDYDSNLSLGLLKREENKLDEAMAYLRRAQRMRPKDPGVAYALGRVHLAAGRVEEARKEFELLVAAVPAYQQGHVLLATVYYRLGLRELGDAQRVIVDKLRAEARTKETGAEPDIGPTNFGAAPQPAPPSAAAPPGR